MSKAYRIIGSELSPFSCKVRSYFRFKNIAHRWIIRSLAVQKEYQPYFKIPIIPLVVTPDDIGIQDSTPIIEKLEIQYTDNAVQPSDPLIGFISNLLQEFGDEWANKWMFHYRWSREIDQLCASERCAHMMMPEADETTYRQIAQQVQERMTDRIWFVGSNKQTTTQIESGFKLALEQLNTHFEHHPYLLGSRPSLGDFGLWGQIYTAWTDPTAGALIETRFLNVLAWIQRMLWPRIEGDFEPWSSLENTLMPFLKEQVGARFVPWSVANLEAVTHGLDEFSVQLANQNWVQKPQKYHAKSLKALRDKYIAVTDKNCLDPVLEKAGCLRGLQP